MAKKKKKVKKKVRGKKRVTVKKRKTPITAERIVAALEKGKTVYLELYYKGSRSGFSRLRELTRSEGSRYHSDKERYIRYGSTALIRSCWMPSDFDPRNTPTRTWVYRMFEYDRNQNLEIRKAVTRQIQTKVIEKSL